MYVSDKELEFFIDIEDGVVVNCDKHYITSTIDNLVINTIQYTNKGTITIILKKENNNIIFSIKDDGIGIPKHELNDIFGVFTVSSKTKTPAGGRGIGLALCEKAIKSHDGKIWAESNGQKGAKFTFVI